MNDDARARAEGDAQMATLDEMRRRLDAQRLEDQQRDDERRRDDDERRDRDERDRREREQQARADRADAAKDALERACVERGVDWSKGRELQTPANNRTDYSEINRLEEAKMKAELEVSIGCDLPDAPAHWSAFDRQIFYQDVAGAARTYYAESFKTPEDAVAAHAKYFTERVDGVQNNARDNITAMFSSNGEREQAPTDHDRTER